MGLGPPVCTKCRVIQKLREDGWRCPKCDESPNESLWELSEEDQKEFELNTYR